MSLLDYYKEKQGNASWKADYEGSASNTHAKILPYSGTCFRETLSFLKHTAEIGPAIGHTRSETLITRDGRISDPHKQRVVGLEDAKLIKRPNNIYQYTEKGKEVLRLKQSNLSSNEKKIAMIILLLDFTENNKLSVINAAMKKQLELFNAGIDTAKQLRLIKGAILTSDKYELIEKDGFWLLTFSNDSEFIERYNSSSNEEKQELFSYVKQELLKSSTNDLIGYKYRTGGSYGHKTFTDELLTIFSIYIMMSIMDEDYSKYIELICRIYPGCDANNILNYIEEKKNFYKESYDNSIILTRNKMEARQWE